MKSKGETKHRKADHPPEKDRSDEPDGSGTEKFKRKDYEKKLAKLHGELVKLQEWVRHEGRKVCIIFEGRDGAGKGGTIKAITARISPRIFKVIALAAPTEREKSQMYIQRYLTHLPAAGEVVIFDRSWYNRAGVERVMKFCSEDDVERFLKVVPHVEKAIVDSGVILLKYWLEVGPEEQTKRLKERIDDRPQDLEAHRDGSALVRPLGRLHQGARRHVPGDGYRMGSLVRRAIRRQEACPAEYHRAPARPDSLQGRAAKEGEAAETARESGPQAGRPCDKVRSRCALRTGNATAAAHK